MTCLPGPGRRLAASTSTDGGGKPVSPGQTWVVPLEHPLSSCLKVFRYPVIHPLVVFLRLFRVAKVGVGLVNLRQCSMQLCAFQTFCGGLAKLPACVDISSDGLGNPPTGLKLPEALLDVPDGLLQLFH